MEPSPRMATNRRASTSSETDSIVDRVPPLKDEGAEAPAGKSGRKVSLGRLGSFRVSTMASERLSSPSKSAKSRSKKGEQFLRQSAAETTFLSHSASLPVESSTCTDTTSASTSTSTSTDSSGRLRSTSEPIHVFPPSSPSRRPRSCMTVRTLEESISSISDMDAGGGAGGSGSPRPGSPSKSRSRASSSNLDRQTSFHSHITFRHFPLEVADYPDIKTGPGIGIGWDPIGPDEHVELDEHEENKPEEKRSHRDMHLVVFQRWNVLVEAGYTRKEIEAEMKKIEKERKKDFGNGGNTAWMDIIKSSMKSSGSIKNSKKGGDECEGAALGAADENEETGSSSDRNKKKKRASSVFSKKLGKGKKGKKKHDTFVDGYGDRAGKTNRDFPDDFDEEYDSEMDKKISSARPQRGRNGSVHHCSKYDNGDFDFDDDEYDSDMDKKISSAPPRRGKNGSVHHCAQFDKLFAAKKAEKATAAKTDDAEREDEENVDLALSRAAEKAEEGTPSRTDPGPRHVPFVRMQEGAATVTKDELESISRSIPPSARMRVFYESEEAQECVRGHLEEYVQEQQQRLSGIVDGKSCHKASWVAVDIHSEGWWGIELGQALFWEACVVARLGRRRETTTMSLPAERRDDINSSSGSQNSSPAAQQQSDNLEKVRVMRHSSDDNDRDIEEEEEEDDEGRQQDLLVVCQRSSPPRKPNKADPGDSTANAKPSMEELKAKVLDPTTLFLAREDDDNIVPVEEDEGTLSSPGTSGSNGGILPQ